MKEHAEGNITRIQATDGTTVYNILAPAVICIPSTETCLSIEFLIDTGSDKSMISYQDGVELGLGAPAVNEKTRNAFDANGGPVPYVMRKVDMALGSIRKEGLDICWCTRPRIGKNFLGMDFLKDYKTILHGKDMKCYIIKSDSCIKCRQ